MARVTMVHTDNLKYGALFMVASGLLFASMATIIKIVSISLPNEMVVFFRSVIGMLVLLPWLWHRGWGVVKTRRLGLHLMRSLFGLAAMYCFFYAIAHIPLAEATLLNFSTPLFVPFIALLWLGEGVPHKLWWAIGIGFLGILFILKPGMALFTPVSLVGLASGIFAAVAMVGIRRLTRSEPAIRIVFYFTATSAVVSAVPLLWAWRTPDPALWFLLIAVGVLASLAQLLLTRAYVYAPAAQVGPFTYATVAFAAIAGWMLWNEVLDALSFVGAVLVCIAGILAIRRGGPRLAPAAELPDLEKLKTTVK